MLIGEWRPENFNEVCDSLTIIDHSSVEIGTMPSSRSSIRQRKMAIPVRLAPTEGS